MSQVFAALGVMLEGTRFTLRADGRTYTSATMPQRGPGTWEADGVEVTLRETSAARHAAQVANAVAARHDGSWGIVLEATGVDLVEEVCLLDHAVAADPLELVNHRWWAFWGLQESTAVFARFGDGGFFAAYANPFGHADLDGNHIRLSYSPGLRCGGRFTSDPLVLGTFARTGRVVRRDALPGRDLIDGELSGYVSMLGSFPAALDAGEIAAVRAAVASRVPWAPERAWFAQWDWGTNLYRRPFGEAGTEEIYERLFQLQAELGIDVALVAPNLGEHAWDVDGPWQHIMWLGTGLEVERGQWAPGDEPGPVRWLLETAKRHGLRLVAYSNPQILWDRTQRFAVEVDADALGWPSQEDPGGGEEERGTACGSSSEAVAAQPAAQVAKAVAAQPAAQVATAVAAQPAAQVATAVAAQTEAGYVWTCLGEPEARDRAIAAYRSFIEANDLGGMSLDFVYWAPCKAEHHPHLPGTAGRYAQWDGYRRLLAALSEGGEAWVEGLIGSQQLAPWGLAGMTHPHPSLGDNQPQWMPAWPDLSLDRVCGNYQRRIAFWLRNFAFAPTYKIPGQIGHQSNRLHDWPVERGWDWEGARYGLLSSIASAPSTTVLCFTPCWDEAEWKGMRSRDGAFFAHWIAFAKEHAQVLAGLEDLFEEARPGAVDGTIATRADGTGFIFLANPDYDSQWVAVPHDEGMLLRELHPAEGRLWHGEVEVDPHEVAVLELVLALEIARPALLGVAGTLNLDGLITTAEGTPGSIVQARILGPAGILPAPAIEFAADGVTPVLGPFQDATGSTVELAALAAAQAQRIMTQWVPGKALPSLLDQLAPPVRPEGDERRQPWSDPSRLRLFFEILDPLPVALRCWVDEDEVEVQQAYVGTFEHVTDPSIMKVPHNLMGHYVDLDDRLRTADDLQQPWKIELEISGLAPERFRAVRIAHLPPRRTTQHAIRG